MLFNLKEFFPSKPTKLIFLLVGQKVHFLSSVGKTNPFFDSQVEKKSYITREKHLFYFCDCCLHFAPALNFTLAK